MLLTAKREFWLHQPLLWVLKYVPHVIYFWRVWKKKNSLSSESSESEFYGGWHINSMFWTLINSLVLVEVWKRVWNLALSWWWIILLLICFFRVSPMTLTNKCSCIIHSWLSFVALTLTMWPVAPIKQATICFYAILPRTTFIRFGSCWKTYAAIWSFLPAHMQ